MGWGNPPVPWPELERRLSGRGSGPLWPATLASSESEKLSWPPAPDGVPYVELHAHSNYSFLTGVSSPEQLLRTAVRLGLAGMALSDHNGFYGAAQFATAAADFPGFLSCFGAEVTLRNPAVLGLGAATARLVLLARGTKGYKSLSTAITRAQLAGGEKNNPFFELEELAKQAAGNWVVLTGDDSGLVPAAWQEGGIAGAGAQLERLRRLFGADNVFVELFDHLAPQDQPRNDALYGVAKRLGCGVVATNNVHYARPEDYRLAATVAAVRHRTTLSELDGELAASSAAHLRSGAEMARRFRRYPEAVAATLPLAQAIAFNLRELRPGLPDHPVPDGHTPYSWLAKLVWDGVVRHYPNADAAVHERVQSELAVIEQKDFAGYFLLVHDIVQFARGRGILCQGRGSAANSAVCFVLDITAVDAIFYRLPFERFLSSLRTEEPDIDVDFDARRREEVIQYVYGRYGRYRAAQVANVISYRPRNALRDVSRALGYSQGLQDGWSKEVSGRHSNLDEVEGPPELVKQLSRALLKAPRHLGIHSGGMVLTKHPVSEICPVEPARAPGRTVLQWDKDDCAAFGLVKFDLLGLGMLSSLSQLFELIAKHCGERWDLASIPKEESAVYDMLCRGDAVGLFQVESRAQLATLPRLRPRNFYDLAIEIALIRPGPIQGGAIHPYLRRRGGSEQVVYPHPLAEPVLKRTLGVPLFQEQLMQLAVAVAGCSAEDADALRRAMSSKRGLEKIDALKTKLYEGMAANDIGAEVADDLYARIEAFANFGFAESHSLSFALLVYASAWLRLHYPAAYLAALLRAQPMGFYSPQTLIMDAKRHGVRVLGIDINSSDIQATLEVIDDPTPGATAGLRAACLAPKQPPVGDFDSSAPDESPKHRRDGGLAVRLGLGTVRGLGAAEARRILEQRTVGGPFVSVSNLVERCGVRALALDALIAAGAFDSVAATSGSAARTRKAAAVPGAGRRSQLWEAGSFRGDPMQQLSGATISVQPPLLPELDGAEALAYEVWAAGASASGHPFKYLREHLARLGCKQLADLVRVESGTRVKVAGLITHRQRPPTANGVAFINLEDETGMLNVVCSVGAWQRFGRVVRSSPALVVRGLVQRSSEGVTSLVADHCEKLDGEFYLHSRDFK